MRGRLSRRFAAALMSGLIAVAMGLSLAATASASVGTQDPVPIGPNQYFRGFINNHPPGAAVITVICPGPVNTGHPAAGQKIEVRTAQPTSTFDIGFTGSAGRKITAALAFLRNGGQRAIITSARLLRAAADGVPGAGTCIERASVPAGSLT